MEFFYGSSEEPELTKESIESVWYHILVLFEMIWFPNAM